MSGDGESAPQSTAGDRAATDPLLNLRALTDSTLTPVDVDALLVEVLARVREIVDADTAAVLLLNESAGELVARAASGIEEEVRQGVRVPLGTGFAGRIAATRQAVRLDRVDESTVANPILWEKRIKTMLGVPLLRDDRVLGVMHVGRLQRRPFSDADIEQLSQDDLRNGELFFGAPAALIILLLVFGAVVAGLIPLVLAILSIVVALALTAIVGQFFELSVFVQNMIFGMGLALGIDYSLFILSRFREERSQGKEKLQAIEMAGATASRAVLFSGLAFVLAMFGLELVPNTIMRSLATGAILVGIVSVVAALTLLPAVISLLGDRINAGRIPYFGRKASEATESRFWGRIVGAVMRRPVVSLVAAVALLLACAVPILSYKTGEAGISTLPDRFESKQGFLLLNEEFPGQTIDPVQVVVDGNTESDELKAAVVGLESELADRPIFGSATQETSHGHDLLVLTVPVAGDPLSDEAVAAVRELRSELIPTVFEGSGIPVYVGGSTAEEIDYFDVMDRWLPIVFVFVLALSFILLTVAFRSVVVPATAIAMNLLSVGAAYGLLVLVFVKGVGNEIFGFQQVDAIEAWVPLFLFAVLFGLSMDYQVFLLSRIREKFSESGDNDLAVSFGVGSTARLITGAALIIIAVFSGFARGDLVMFQQMGFGIAVALLIDATIVRSVLVPASMKLLGRWNWYLPTWLEWLPDVHVEGGSRARESGPPTPAPARPSAR